MIFFLFTVTIRLRAREFYEVIVDEGELSPQEIESE